MMLSRNIKSFTKEKIRDWFIGQPISDKDEKFQDIWLHRSWIFLLGFSFILFLVFMWGISTPYRMILTEKINENSLPKMDFYTFPNEIFKNPVWLEEKKEKFIPTNPQRDDETFAEWQNRFFGGIPRGKMKPVESILPEELPKEEEIQTEDMETLPESVLSEPEGKTASKVF